MNILRRRASVAGRLIVLTLLVVSAIGQLQLPLSHPPTALIANHTGYDNGPAIISYLERGVK